jgi:hypothetical protein
LVNSTPGRENAAMALGQFEAGLEQVFARHLARDQSDAFGLVGVHVAAGEHDLERPRRADRPR